MKRLTILMLLLTLVTALPAQQKKSAGQKAVSSKTTTVRKQSATKKQPAKKQPAKKGTKQQKQQPVTVQSLKNQRQQLQKQMQEQQRRLRENERNVKQRLQNLMVINTEIDDKRRTIDTIRRDIGVLNGNIVEMDKQLKVLEQELTDRKQRYMKSMRYMHRNRSIQSQLMFIFSAHNFSQMYRRMRFVREYAVYQRAQGEAVKTMQAEVAEAVSELTDVKRRKNDLLYRGEQEKKALEGKQVEQQNVVSTLQKQQKTIQGILDQQQKKDAELNAQIDRLIAEEIARAKARAEAERKRKEAEAAAKKRAEELARKKAAAEAAAREHARRVAEAKAREEKAKAEARAAARKSAEEKRAAERAARKAEEARRAEERKAAAAAKAREREMAAARKKAKEESDYTVSSEDRRLSGSFESNRGRLPMPVAGGYQIVNRFGQYAVDGLKGHVTLDNKGINIKGQPGAQARCVFDGEVSAVFGYGGSTVVIVRHGSYLSVYTNLASVSVTRGQKVNTRQTIGRLASDGIMQFQLRRGSTPLNPMTWLSR
ncbi:MAG: peptidoglycan DD-metalloendopeptidase family protein [Prevotella sp.]|nr:peptidoglycan DD-metalloendopeptidase family protein [Prevotella sp.]